MNIMQHFFQQVCRHHVVSEDIFPRNGDDTFKWTSRFANTDYLNGLLVELKANVKLANNVAPGDLSADLGKLWQAAAHTLETINWAGQKNEAVSSQAARLYYLIIGAIWKLINASPWIRPQHMDFPGSLEPFEGLLQASGWGQLWKSGDVKGSIEAIERAASEIRK